MSNGNDGDERGCDVIGCAGVLLVLVLFIGLFAGFMRRPQTQAAAALTTPTPFPTAEATRLPTLTPTKIVVMVRPTTPAPIVARVIETAVPTDIAPTTAATQTATPLPIATNTQPALLETKETIAPLPTETATATPTPTHTPLPTPVGVLSAVRVPILMYHYVSDPPWGADKYRVDLSVSPDVLRQQLTWLRDNDYTTISLYQLSRAMTNQEPLPPKSVVLTFDDGHRDHYTQAFPLLQEFGMTGTFFIITNLADTWNDNHLLWPMIEEMHAAGMSMEMHTRTHPTLTTLGRDEIIEQITDSRNALSHHLDVSPRYLAYPGGRYSQEIVNIVAELDLWGAVTTAYSIDHTYENRYRMDRVRMRYTTSLPTFAAFVRGEIE